MELKNYNVDGTAITDEPITGSLTAQHLAHDNFFDLVIYTLESSAGTLLVLDTDYTIGGADSFYSTYNTITFINYIDTEVFASYKTKGDYVDADDVNAKADKIIPDAAGNFAGLDMDGNLEDSGVSVEKTDDGYLINIEDEIVPIKGYNINPNGSTTFVGISPEATIISELPHQKAEFDIEPTTIVNVLGTKALSSNALETTNTKFDKLFGKLGTNTNFTSMFYNLDNTCVFDNKLWLIPSNSAKLVSVEPNGEGDYTLTGYDRNAIYTGTYAFFGGVVYDDKLWLISYNSTKLVSVEPDGEGDYTLTGYDRNDIYTGGYAFIGGAVYDDKLWLIPYYSTKLVSVEPDGEGDYTLTGYDRNAIYTGTGAFTGGAVYDDKLWLIPFNSTKLVSVEPDGEGDYTLTGYDRNAIYTGTGAFTGGAVYDDKLWLIPANSTKLVSVEPDGEGDYTLTGYDRNAIYTGGYAFVGGVVYDDKLWLIPSYSTKLVSVEPDGEGDYTLTGYDRNAIYTGTGAFAGGAVYDDKLWLIPFNSTKLVSVEPDGEGGYTFTSEATNTIADLTDMGALPPALANTYDVDDWADLTAAQLDGLIPYVDSAGSVGWNFTDGAFTSEIENTTTGDVIELPEMHGYDGVWDTLDTKYWNRVTITASSTAIVLADYKLDSTAILVNNVTGQTATTSSSSTTLTTAWSDVEHTVIYQLADTNTQSEVLNRHITLLNGTNNITLPDNAIIAIEGTTDLEAAECSFFQEQTTVKGKAIFTGKADDVVLRNAENQFSKTQGFVYTDNGNSGTTKTLDWKNSNKQKITLNGNCTFTFTAPSYAANLLLVLVQDATGSRTITWPATVKWAEGTAPTLSTAANSIDIASFFYDGTNYYGSVAKGFA
jgi:hypothetical protein